MVQEKAFHLKIRKAGIRWGCSCCQPTGRDIKSRAARRTINRIVRGKKKKERRLFLDLMEEQFD